MKRFLFLFLLLATTPCLSQWTTLPNPPVVRYDDVFFINDSVGWAAGGSNLRIYTTTDGGARWREQYNSRKYLRSITFATPDLGFRGSLDSSLYRTTDGGASWTDIAGSITPKPPGICGLSTPTADVIYGCGVWSSPAYVIKSTDGGNNWTNIDLSSFANALVDIHFSSPDTGWVAGMANPSTDGGIILYTTDGGSTWTVKHKTLTPHDSIWKLQTPDGC